MEEQPQTPHGHKPFWWWLLGAAFILVVVIIIIRNGNGEYVAAEAQYRTLEQRAEFTGSVVPADQVNLAFNMTGILREIAARVGDTVGAGSLLARLDTRTLEAQINGARADLESAEANLRELERGTRPEEIMLQEEKVEKNEKAVSDAETLLAGEIRSSFTDSDNAIRNNSDVLFENPRSNNPDLIFTTDFQTEINLEESRKEVESILNNWENNIVLMPPEESLAESYPVSLQNASAINLFLGDLAFALNSLTPTSEYPQTTLDSWKSAIASARTTLDTTLTSLVQKQEALNTARSNLSVTESELSLLLAGSTQEDIDAARAAVTKADALVDQYESELSQRVLRAPIPGVVSVSDLEVGEVAQANVPFISIISRGQYEIDASVSELDIAGIVVGADSFVTFDAFPGEAPAAATVIEVDPAETEINNIPSYGVTLVLVGGDDRIKSGMTANIEVVTLQRENVLSIPISVVQFEDTSTFVEVLVDGEAQRRDIELGIQSYDGFAEIIKGLSEGETVIQR